MCRWSTAAIFACDAERLAQIRGEAEHLAAIRAHGMGGGVALVLEHGEELLAERFEFAGDGLHRLHRLRSSRAPT